jgi:hypothetical protein
MKLTRPRRHTQWFTLALGLAIAVGLASVSAFPTPSSAQNTAKATTTTAPGATALGLQCTSLPVRNNPPTPDPLKGQMDPFLGPLAGPSLPAGLLTISDATRKSIFRAGLPCQEKVSPSGQETVAPDNRQPAGLDNLQRGFDFYSWRTFIALNSPADGTPIEQAQAGAPTLWEDMNSFKQLLDVMLPANQLPPTWPTDRAGMEAERERLMPPECRDLHQKMPERMIVKMIEESFNEPFKTGPLIDQQGHYAIFDILMDRQMFDYIMLNHLNTKAGQAANSSLVVDFPAGLNSNNNLGAFMLKVSWKILSDSEIQAKNFHMVKALVLTPPIPNAARKCLPETLGLIGFHAVHKTASRPQWIWTSFEHVKNVPDKAEVTAKQFSGPYNFYSVNCKGACTANATPPTPWDPDPALELKFRHDDSFKSQIVRETPLTPAAKNMNTIFQSMLTNSVWKNYMLISTQWPSAFSCTSLRAKSPSIPDPKTDFLKQPDMTCSPAPAFLANSTLETYSQGDIPLASSSCIACHGNAVGFQKSASNPQPGKPNLNQSDFTFILEKAQ